MQVRHSYLSCIRSHCEERLLENVTTGSARLVNSYWVSFRTSYPASEAMALNVCKRYSLSITITNILVDKRLLSLSYAPFKASELYWTARFDGAFFRAPLAVIVSYARAHDLPNAGVGREQLINDILDHVLAGDCREQARRSPASVPIGCHEALIETLYRDT